PFRTGSTATSMPRTDMGSLVSGTCRSETATATTASGTLIRKIRRQDPTPTSHPPTNGPIAAATPDNPDQPPTAPAPDEGADGGGDPGHPRPGTPGSPTVAGCE